MPNRVSASRRVGATTTTLECLDPPEIDGLAECEPVGIASTAPESDAPHQAVEQPRAAHASGSEYQPRSPPMPSITRHTVSQRRVDIGLAFVAVDAAARPVRVGGHRIAGRARPRRPGPPSDDVNVADLLQRFLDRIVEPHWMHGHERVDVVLAATTEFRNDSISGYAIAFGTGVTTLTHWLDNHGVNTGTARMSRCGRPATLAYRCIISS